MKTVFFAFLIIIGTLSSYAQTPQSIMKSIQSGKQPTEKELKILQKYAEETAKQYSKKEGEKSELEAEAEGPETEFESEDELDDFSVKMKVVKKRSTSIEVAVPTRAEVVALAKNLQSKYGKISGVDQAQFVSSYPQSIADKAGDLSAALLGTGAGSAAIYSAAYSVAVNPDDVVSLNNLGAALSGMNESLTALKILKYGLKLSPSTLLLSLNSGWAYYQLGDLDNAEKLFKSLSVDKEIGPSAYLGLAAVEESKNNSLKALHYYKMSDEMRRTPLSFAGVRKGNNKSKGNKEENGSDVVDPNGNDSGGDDSASGFEASSESTSALSNYKYGVPNDLNPGVITLPGIEATARLADKIGQSIKSDGQAMLDAVNELQAIKKKVEEYVQGLSKTKSTHNSILSIERNNDMESEMINDIERILMRNKNSQYRKMYDKYMAEDYILLMEQTLEIQQQHVQEHAALSEKFNHTESEQARDQIRYKMCLAEKQMYQRLFEIYKQQYTPMALVVNQTIDDLYGFTTPIIERAYDPKLYLTEILNLGRKMGALEMKMTLHITLAGAAGLAKEYQSLECVPPAEGGGEDDIDSTQLSYTDSKCMLGNGVGISFGVVGVKLDCTSFEISGGEGFLGKVKHDFKSNQTTLYAGIGVKGGLKTTGGKDGLGGDSKTYSTDISGELSVGYLVVIDGNNNITDHGVETSAKLEVGRLSTEATVRFWAEAGPQTEFGSLSIKLD